MFSSDTASAAGKVDATGTNDGAAFKIDIPANWNGTLVLYSHGYVPPCNPADPKCNPPSDAGDQLTGKYRGIAFFPHRDPFRGKFDPRADPLRGGIAAGGGL